MEWWKKITEFVMPGGFDYDEEQEKDEVRKVEAASKAEEKKAEASTAATQATAIETEAVSMRAAAGGGYGSTMKLNAEQPIPVPPASMRPTLTVLENKIKELNVKIYNPTKYDQASEIAANILNKNVAVVNYEYVEAPVQLRICDFLNGVCYVTDGYTDKISEKIFLYVPDGVDTQDIAEAVSSASNNHYRRGMFAS